MRPRFAPVLIVGTLTLAACSPSAEPAADVTVATAAPAAATVTDTPDGRGVRIVRTDEAALLVEEPSATVLDVRTPAEFAAGHLEGAVNIDMQAPDAVQRFSELDPTASYVLYCQSGNRSSVVREHLREAGFVDVADVYGGIVSWQEAGQEVVR